MPLLSTIKNIKQSLGIGNANYIPFINFGTGSPAPVRNQVLGTQTQAPAPSVNNPVASTQYSYPVGPSYTPPAPRPTGGGQSSQNIGTQQQTNTVNQNANDLQGQADFEFEQALSVIGQQEGALRGQSEADISAQQVAGTGAVNRATQAKGKNIQGLESEQATAEKQTSGGLKQARDLFRQLQQQNIAQLSGLGISSSSVAEALAEKLGVETAQRINGLTGSLEEVRLNIAKEKTNVENVFQSKLTEIQQQTDAAIQGIRANLATQLAQLASLRGQAATQKAQARTDIAVNARNQIQAIQLEAQQRAQGIQDAAARRQQALQEAEQYMFKPTDFTGIGNAIQGIQGLPQVPGLTLQPQLNYQNVAGQPFVGVQGQYVQNKGQQNPYQPGTQEYNDWETLQALNG